MNVYFKGKRIDTNEWVVGFFTKKKIGSLIVPVIEVYKEWDSGDYMETYEIDGSTLTDATSNEWEEVCNCKMSGTCRYEIIMHNKQNECRHKIAN